MYADELKKCNSFAVFGFHAPYYSLPLPRGRLIFRLGEGTRYFSVGFFGAGGMLLSHYFSFKSYSVIVIGNNYGHLIVLVGGIKTIHWEAIVQ